MRRLEAHHMLWTKKTWEMQPLSKKVRKLSTYIIAIPYINHRLIHASMTPPDVPDIDTLRFMNNKSPDGLEIVINTLEHPIATHLGRQMLLATMSEENAEDLLHTGEYLTMFKDDA